jgi:hypothetical protein
MPSAAVIATASKVKRMVPYFDFMGAPNDREQQTHPVWIPEGVRANVAHRFPPPQ